MVQHYILPLVLTCLIVEVLSSPTSPPAALKQQGESCGDCMCPPSFTAGTCAAGLTCVHNPMIEDAPGICTPTETLKAEGESCGSCFCPPTYSAGTCQDGLVCDTNPMLPDAGGKCRAPEDVKKREGESCGTNERWIWETDTWEEFNAGTCQDGLDCNIDPDTMISVCEWPRINLQDFL